MQSFNLRSFKAQLMGVSAAIQGSPAIAVAIVVVVVAIVATGCTLWISPKWLKAGYCHRARRRKSGACHECMRLNWHSSSYISCFHAHREQRLHASGVARQDQYEFRVGDRVPTREPCILGHRTRPSNANRTCRPLGPQPPSSFFIRDFLVLLSEISYFS